MRYRVYHRTTYSYSAPVRDSVGEYHLVPRVLAWQRVESTDVDVSPAAGDVARRSDWFGNSATYFHVTEPHPELVVTATSDVDVEAPEYPDAALAAPWERSRPLLHPAEPGAWQAAEFAMESARARHSDAVTSYAAQSLTPGRAVGEAVTDLMNRIHADFHYDPTATTVTSPVADVFAGRAGVCQDFAHLALAGLRAHGVAARYVSGYLATKPAPGKERVFGADASHAWIAVWLPGSDAWLAVDPTNDQWQNDRYITVAWGRDYGDVSPVKGIIVTRGKKSRLRVSVDVAPLD